MRASLKDLDKVMDVTKDQILASLNDEPQSVDEFKAKLPTYAQIADIWKEGIKRKGEEDCEAIKALKNVIQPDILGLIKQQRLNFICEGTQFTKQKKTQGGKFIYVKLSPNKKTLCFGDWNNDKTVPEVDELSGKMPICDIKAFQKGKHSLIGIGPSPPKIP